MKIPFLSLFLASTTTSASHLRNGNEHRVLQGIRDPILRYEFDDLTESTTEDDAFKLFLPNDPSGFENTAELKTDQDGTYLSCDGIGDYVLMESNLGIQLSSHSLSVWVRLKNLPNGGPSMGGGAITIDGNYDAQGNYAHGQYDSLVFNEISNNKKWILGSEFHQRTNRDGGLTVESVPGEWVHMVAIYDMDNQIAKMYRNGIEEQNYNPGGFKNDFVNSRVMFCQRHWQAGGSDFAGDVDLGEVYDYALSPEDVEYLYQRGREVGKNGGGGGDPHFKLWSGHYFDYHGECDLVLLSSPQFDDGLGLTIHIRTRLRRDYSYIESAAIQVGSDILQVDSWGGYHINGVSEGTLPFLLGNKFEVTHVQKTRKLHAFVITLDDSKNETIVVTTFKDMVSIAVQNADSANFGTSLGMMGSFHNGSLLARDGTTIMKDFNLFGKEWMVKVSEPQLFESSADHLGTCVLPAAISDGRRLGQKTISKEDAEFACIQFQGDKKDMCIADVMATGDLEFAEVHGAF